MSLLNNYMEFVRKKDDNLTQFKNGSEANGLGGSTRNENDINKL